MRIEEINIHNANEYDLLLHLIKNPPNIKYVNYTILLDDDYLEKQMLLHLKYENEEYHLTHYRDFNFTIDFQSNIKLNSEKLIELIKLIKIKSSKEWLDEYQFKKIDFDSEIDDNDYTITSNSNFEEISKNSYSLSSEDLDENYEFIKKVYYEAKTVKKTIVNLEKLFWKVHLLYINVLETKLEYFKQFLLNEANELSNLILEKTKSQKIRDKIEYVIWRFYDEDNNK